jgi:hypothetical protein
MKKLAILILVLLLFAGVFTVSAALTQEAVDSLILGLGQDFGLFLDGMGEDITPILLQNAISGQNVGIAELGDSNFYFNIIPVIGVTTASGLLSNRTSNTYYQVVNLDKTIYEMIPEEYSGLTDVFFNNMTPIPAFKINFGMKLPADLELLVTGFWLPDFLVPAVLSLFPDLSLDIGLSALNIGGVLRYPLLKDSEQSPGLSVGAGFYYDNLHASMGLAGLLNPALAVMELELPSTAAVSFDTSVLAFGAELTVSKTLLFFAPYAKLGAWYGMSSLTGQAILTSTTPITGGKSVADFAFIAGTGFDLLFGGFCINVSGNYNLGSGIWGASIGSRFQF